MRGSMEAFPPFANALESVRCQVIVLDLLEPAIDKLPQVEGLRTPGLRGQGSKPLLNIGR